MESQVADVIICHAWCLQPAYMYKFLRAEAAGAIISTMQHCNYLQLGGGGLAGQLYSNLAGGFSSLKLCRDVYHAEL